MTKFTPEETLETILAREIRKEIDTELIRWLKDPESKLNLEPMTCEPGQEEEFRKWCDDAKKYADMIISRDIDSPEE